MIEETLESGPADADKPGAASTPKPVDRAIKSGEVKVRVVTHALFEGGQRYVKGQEFITTTKRAKGLKGFVEEVQ